MKSSHTEKLEKTIESPCKRNCCLDADDICLGCYRHLTEITGWQALTDDKKHQVLLRCQDRREQRK